MGRGRALEGVAGPATLRGFAPSRARDGAGLP